MKKQKIAFCVRDMQVGGVENVMLRTMEELLSHGNVELSVITYVKITEPLYRRWFDAHPDVRVINLYPMPGMGTKLVHFFPVKIVQHMLRDIYRWFKRTTMSTRRFADIDVFIDYYDFSFAREFRKIKRPKLVWWHSSIDKFIDSGNIKNIGTYDMMVALTHGFVDEFRRCYGDYANKITQIYNPIDIAGIVRRANGAPTFNGGDYFCSVARLSRDKDIKTLLLGFDRFYEIAGQPDAKLVIVGDGDCREEYQRFAQTLSSKDNIIFAGKMANPFGYMRDARVHILSSRGEGMAMVLVEAAALGTLNIASDCRNGPREILMDGAAGMLYSSGDADGLAKCLVDAWRDRAGAAKKIKVARQNLYRFDADEIIPQILRLISRVSK